MLAPNAKAFLARGGDLVFYAASKLRRKLYDECAAICTVLLAKNPYDQSVWYMKCQALTALSWIDDTDMEEEGIAEIMLDQNALSEMPRPGTSLARPMASRAGAPSPSVRPMSSSGRPLTGYARPGTSSRPNTGQGGIEGAFKGGRAGTARPVTSSGRFVRLGTASMISEPGGPFINLDRLDFGKYVGRPALAKVLCDYIIYHLHEPRRALELCSLATVAAEYKDWWWKARLGKCYYQLGLNRDAERQFLSVLKVPGSQMVISVLELAKVYLKMDQPQKAMEVYRAHSERNPGEIYTLLGVARIHDQINDVAEAVKVYRTVLHYDSSNVEAIACLASNYFYSDQPEMALRFYRRLLQMGLRTAELWNNIGMCCFYASQYDMCLTCYERALAIADDSNSADIWHNVGQVAIGIGDLGLAYQAFKIAVSVDINHSESFNNLGVLELRKHNPEAARSNFQTAHTLAEHMFEPLYNSALLSFKLGDFQQSFDHVSKALERYPLHTESAELRKQLTAHFTSL